MKGSYKFGIGIVIAAILVIGVIQASQKTPTDWNKTLNPKDKIPFGTYVMRHELKRIFPENQTFRAIEQSVYTFLNDSVRSKAEQDFIFVGTTFSPGKASLKSLLKYVAKGNNALISAWDLEEELRDTLRLSLATFNSYDAGVSPNSDSFYYQMAATKETARFGKNDYPEFFIKLDSANTTILGYLVREKIKLPNFVRVRFGKGNFYLQLTPDVYSNYFLLNYKTYRIAYASLHHLSGRHILWYDGFYNQDISRTPLRFILRQPALRAGWYLLLVTLLLFLIFKSKREQKAIPIVVPEENKSVAFAETIGSLYYENGHPGNMIEKKIQYFFYYLKKDFRFDEVTVSDALFRKSAAIKLKVTEQEINTFFDRLQYYQSLQKPAASDLKLLEELIEDFKQKIKQS